jgi:hypothetical protein
LAVTVSDAGRHGTQRGQAVGHLEPALEPALLGDVAQDKDPAQDLAVLDHQRHGLADHVLAARDLEPALDRDPVVGGGAQPDAAARRRRLLGDQVVEGPADRGGRAGREQGLGRRVEEHDAAGRIGAHHGVGDRAQRGLEPALVLADPLLDAVAVQRQLDCAAQLGRLHRLHQVAQRLGALGPLDGGLVGVRGQVHDGHAVAIAEQCGSGDAVDRPLDADVHQHQVGDRLAGPLQRLVGGRRHRRHLVAELGQRLLDVVGDDALVLDDEDARRAGHDRDHVVPRKRMTTRVPASRSTTSVASS